MKRHVWFVWLPALVILCLFLFLNTKENQAEETQKQDFVSEEIENTPQEDYYDRFFRMDSIFREIDESEKTKTGNSVETKNYDYYKKQLEAKLKALGYKYKARDDDFFLTVQLKSGRTQLIAIATVLDEDRGAAIYCIASLISNIHEKIKEENILVEKILSKKDEDTYQGRFYKNTEDRILLYENVMSASLIDDLEFFLLDVATIADETEKQFTDMDKY